MFFNSIDMSVLEDCSGLGHLEVTRKDVSSGAGEPSSSLKLVRQFPAVSVDPDRKRTVILTIPADARALYALVGLANYLCFLVTEEDEAMTHEVGTSRLFNESHQALNRVRHIFFVSFANFV